MSTEFSPEVSQLIAQVFSSGRYPNEDALLTEAVRLLGERDRLREQIGAGAQQLASGHYTDYDSAALRRRFDDLKAGKRFRPQ
jgi:Arc/MetJ-type ribon-helix-helix transcriptional regulator